MNVIICPVVRGKQMTQACVESALAQDIGDVWLYAIDNARGWHWRMAADARRAHHNRQPAQAREPLDACGTRL